MYTRICICKLKHIQLYIYIFYKSTVYGATAYVYNYKRISTVHISVFTIYKHISYLCGDGVQAAVVAAGAPGAILLGDQVHTVTRTT